MTDLFLTGDRSLAPLDALALTVLALDSFVEEEGVLPRLATGNSATGVEAAVRYLFPGVQIFAAGVTPEGKADLNDRHRRVLEDGFGRVLVVHTDPFKSAIYRSVLAVWTDDDAVRIFPV